MSFLFHTTLSWQYVQSRIWQSTLCPLCPDRRLSQGSVDMSSLSWHEVHSRIWQRPSLSWQEVHSRIWRHILSVLAWGPLKGLMEYPLCPSMRSTHKSVDVSSLSWHKVHSRIWQRPCLSWQEVHSRTWWSTLIALACGTLKDPHDPLGSATDFSSQMFRLFYFCHLRNLFNGQINLSDSLKPILPINFLLQWNFVFIFSKIHTGSFNELVPLFIYNKIVI